MREWLHRGEASSHTSWGAPPGQAVTLKPPVLQVNRFNKSRDRALLLTDRHLYKLEPGRQYRVMRAMPLDAVSPVGGQRHSPGSSGPSVLLGTAAGPLPSGLPGMTRAI